MCSLFGLLLITVSHVYLRHTPILTYYLLAEVLNIRNVAGQIIDVIRAGEMRPLRLPYPIVPCLGLILDSYFDMFGYPDRVIQRVYEAGVRTRLVEDFVAYAYPVVNRYEARWYYSVLAIPADRPRRQRLMPRPDADVVAPGN